MAQGEVHLVVSGHQCDLVREVEEVVLPYFLPS